MVVSISMIAKIDQSNLYEACDYAVWTEPASVVTKGLQRINLRRALRRDVARNQRDADQ